MFKTNSWLKDNSRMDFLDSFRAIAVFMVVGVHALGYCVKPPQQYFGIIDFVVHTISVPIFFLVDGYLFAYSRTNKQKVGYYGYVKKSLFRLLVPWIIFTLLYTVMRYIFEISGFLEEKVIVGCSLTDVIVSGYGSVYAPQLYFLFSLFLIRLVAPVSSKLLKVDSFYLLLILLIYIFTYRWFIHIIAPYIEIQGGQEPVLHAIWGIQFYILGIIVFRFQKLLSSNTVIILCATLMIMLLLKLICVVSSVNIVIQYLFLLSLFNLFLCFPKGNYVFNLIGRNTMGIYLIHVPIMLKGVSICINSWILSPLLSYFSITIFVFILSFIFTILINKIPYGCILFGVSYKRKIATLL